MLIDRRLIQHFDWVLLILSLCIMSFGLLAIYSASYVKDGHGGLSPLVIKQLLWIAIGLFGMTVALFWDYRFLEKFAYPIYGVSILMLVLVLIVGSAGGGSQRWLRLGMVSLQPSEFMKFALVVWLASRFQAEGRVRTLKSLLLPLISFVVPLALILPQPDLGTALVIAAVFATLVIVSGYRFLTLAPLIVGGVAVAPFLWKHLRPYQQKRLLSFVNPELDPLGAGYHALQSKIAVGSGQITGQGFMKGTQNRLYFLPEQHTDFVFSVFAEEWGFLGAGLLVALYLFLVIWALRIAEHARDSFGALLATGIASMIFWQVVINIAMVMGMLPVVGITLPLMSYGGSSLLTVMIGLGFLINVSMRRFSLKT